MPTEQGVTSLLAISEHYAGSCRYYGCAAILNFMVLENDTLSGKLSRMPSVDTPPCNSGIIGI